MLKMIYLNSIVVVSPKELVLMTSLPNYPSFVPRTVQNTTHDVSSNYFFDAPVCNINRELPSRVAYGMKKIGGSGNLDYLCRSSNHNRSNVHYNVEH